MNEKLRKTQSYCAV